MDMHIRLLTNFGSLAALGMSFIPKVLGKCPATGHALFAYIIALIGATGKFKSMFLVLLWTLKTFL